jgi:NTE family protein
MKTSSTFKPQTAFVLSGGAALGAVQVGMLRVLLEQGIIPDFIVGTSIGAWNSIWLAMHPDLAWLDRLEALWNHANVFELMGKNALQVVGHRIFRRPYLISDEGMRQFFQSAAMLGEFSPELTFEQLALPCMITATDIMNGELAYFSEGPVLPALLASSAIPGIFPPVILDGKQYIDGGILGDHGMSMAIETGARTIYALLATSSGTLLKPVDTYLELLLRSQRVISMYHMKRELHHYAHQAECIVIEDEQSIHANLLDFTRTQDLFRSGYQSAVNALQRHGTSIIPR